MAWVASRYNVPIPLKRGRRLVYNSLSGSMALWDAEDVETFHRACAGGASGMEAAPLANAGFLVDSHTDELKVMEQAYLAHRFDPKTMILTLAPTLSCNFGCDYCFQGSDKPRDTMGPDVQDAILALIARAAPQLSRLHVAWYGGEPLLRKPIVRDLSDRIVAFCDAHGVGYDASMVSNGYLLDPETAEMLVARRVGSVQITLDGLPNYHDERRALLSGKPTFQRIVANLKAAVERTPMQINLRANVDARNQAQMTDLLDFLAEQGLGNRPNFKIYFAPVEAITAGCHAIEDVTMARSAYGQVEADLYRKACALGLAPLPYPPRFHGTCAAVKPKGLVILPSGDVHKCWDTVNAPKFAVGTIFDLDGLAKSEAAKRWIRWSPLNNAACRSCKLLPSCSGACAYKTIHADQTRGEAAVLPCPSWKYNLKERLLLRAERSGMIAPDDYDPAETRTDPDELCTDVELIPSPAEALAAPAAK